MVGELYVKNSKNENILLILSTNLLKMTSLES